jgi:hypothetical protein
MRDKIVCRELSTATSRTLPLSSTSARRSASAKYSGWQASGEISALIRIALSPTNTRRRSPWAGLRRKQPPTGEGALEARGRMRQRSRTSIPIALGERALC